MHTETPLLSIIIASYNSEKDIENALTSIIEQTFINWECIIIDGKSSDNTINILKEFSEQDKRIKYVSEPDTGIYDAFNKGWKLAQGTWIYYLGSDDIILPTAFYEILSQKEINEYDVVYAGVIRISKNGVQSKSIATGHEKLPYKMLACHQAILTKKTALECLGGFDEELHIIGDKEFYIRMYLENTFKFKRLNNIYIAKFKTGGASSSLKKCLKEDFYIRKKNNLSIKYIIYQIVRTLWLMIK